MQIINRKEDFDFVADNSEDLKHKVEDFYKMYGQKPEVIIEDKNITVTFSDQVEKKIKEDAPRGYATYYYGLVCFYKNLGVYREAFFNGIKGLKYSIDRPEFPGVKEKIKDLTLLLAHRVALNTNIQPIIDTLKEDLEEKLEFPLEIIQDLSMSLAGKLEYAPTYGRDKHILYYNKKRNSVLHTIVHELTHLEMNNAAAKKGKNMIFYFSEAEYKKFLNRHSDFIKNLKDKREIIRSPQVHRIFEGYNLCLLNTPLDLFVEWKIYNKHITFQPLQFEALVTQNTNNINVFKSGIHENVFPIDMLSNVKICNMVSAMLLRDLYGYDSIDEYEPTKYEKTTANDLYNKFRSYVSGRLLPGVEYTYVDYFISVCNAKDYVLKENEEDFVQAHEQAKREKKISQEKDEYQHKHKDGENHFLTMRMAIYMLSALRYFERIHADEIRKIAYEISRLGIQGIDPDKSGYTVKSIIGKEFSGYELLAYYYVSWAQVFPHELEAQNLPLSKAYELALQMYKGKK